MRRHLSEFSKSPLGARSSTVPRLAPRGPAFGARFSADFGRVISPVYKNDDKL